jgi:hypothetical protein
MTPTNIFYETHPITVDIETAPHPCAAEYLDALNLDGIKPAGNLKDPAKIAESLAQRKADATAEHAAKLTRAALDWNLSRIVAIGWSIGAEIIVMPCADEFEERGALEAFWKDAKGRELLGFACRTFDAPTLIQRSRLLKVEHRPLNLARYGKGSIIDLREILTFDDARYEAIMPRSLKMFAKRFDIPVDDAVSGSDVPALIAAGEWEAVIGHVTSDVRLTMALARRIGVLEPETVSA